ncbi:DNA polymerase alpha/epsilon subunit B-domain-containing protein, partial [Hyaloraphidium curvatum]
DRGKVEEVYNSHVPFEPSADNPPGCRPDPQVFLNADPPQPAHGFRYMFEKLTAHGEHLDDQIDRFCEHFLALNPHIEELAHPGLPHQDPVTTAGRICKDAADPTSPALFLEPSRRIGNGVRIPLDLSPLLGISGPGFSLFPGQLVAVTGTNPTGGLLTVTEIHKAPPPPAAATPLSRLRAMYPDDSRPLNLAVAAGPYALEGSLAYEPLEELVAALSREQPDVVLLLGPFVDAQHPMVKNGELDVSLEDLFRTQISRRLTSLLSASPRTRIILLPSLSDALSPYLCLPQPPLPAGLADGETALRARELGLSDPRLLLLPNPAQFTLNELAVAAMSVDALVPLGSEEVHRDPPAGNGGAPPGNRMARLAGHIVASGSLYPLFPPAPSDPVLPSHLHGLALPVRPDVLVVPSQLRHFAREAGGCVAVNPGRLSKGRAGGTWARVCVWPLRVGDAPVKEEGKEEDDEAVENGVAGRCRVEIVRI